MRNFNKIKRAFLIALSLSTACSLMPMNMITYAQASDVTDAEISIIKDNSSMEAVDGTTGAPLGGFGAGAVKFNAMKGSFAATVLPPVDWKDYVSAGESRFQLYTKVNGSIKTVDTLTAAVKDGRYDDDAVWPLHKANFGETNGIQVKLEAFSPLDNENYENMSRPYAFYEVTLKNNNSVDTEASIALLWDLSTGQSSQTSAEYVDGKGFKADRWAVYTEADGAEISAGSDNGFFTSGVCNNSPSLPQTRTAAKVQLAANEIKTVKFVLAWYNNDDPDNAHYLGIYNNAAEIAQLGLENFDTLKTNAEGLVSRMRGSNVPAWYVNQCLNSLANISNNSIYKRDGRVAFAEGQWTCFGTMDQMWHARQIMGNLIPDFAWTELEYWARTQRDDGQIHHDFNYMTDTSVKYKLVPWDDTEHADYRNIDEWVDLNCGFIISVYETYQQTGNDEKLEYFWPYMKKAGQRILKQVELYGDNDYPYTFKKSSNSYDAGGDANPFNASVSAVAYKIMTIICDRMNENELKETYQTAYDTVVKSYSDKYIKNGFQAGRISESYFAGQWLGLHLKLGQIWMEEETEQVLEGLDGYYHPYYKLLGYPEGTYDEWTPYLLAHYGGLLLHTMRQNQYEALQKDSYTRQFKNRNQVFNHALNILPSVTVANYAATNINGKQQYISIPTIWRNYYDVIGYHRDAATKELWLEPLLLSEMNHVMTDAAYVSPEGYGTISCIETASEGSEAYQNKNITFKPEKDIYVSKLYLTDNFGDTDSISVTIDGVDREFTRQGEGYAKVLAVEYNGAVTADGIIIQTSGDPGKEPPELPEKPEDIEVPPVAAEMSAYKTIEAWKPDASGGIEIKTEDETSFLTGCDDQDYAQYNRIGFEDGAGAILITLRSTKESTIDLQLENIGGTTVQLLDIPNTNGEWQTLRYELKQVIADTHNIVFSFRSKTGDSSDLVDIGSFTFEYKYRLSDKSWTVSASKNTNDAVKAVDGDTTTRWQSGVQTGNEWFLIDFGEICAFNRIVLDSTAASKNDYPRRYEVYVSDDGKNFDKMIASGDGTQTTTNITFERQTERYIKILQLGTTETNYWSIYELAVYNDEEDYESGIHEPYVDEPDKTINKYTYAGSLSSHPDGAKGFDITKYKLGAYDAQLHEDNKEYFFSDNVSKEVIEQFADGADKKKLSSTYTCKMVNYIGIGQSGNYNNKPAITDISLPAGQYKLYFIGAPDRAIEIAFVNDSDNSVAVSDVNSYVLSSSNNGLRMNEFYIDVSKAYSGDITFYNSATWLPDLYSVKLVPVNTHEIEYIAPLGDYANKLTIEEISDEGGIKLIISPKDGEPLQPLTMYTAVYNSDNSLKSVEPVTYNANSDGIITVPVAEPQLESGEGYKLMLWNTEQTPLISAITKETSFLKKRYTNY